MFKNKLRHINTVLGFVVLEKIEVKKPVTLVSAIFMHHCTIGNAAAQVNDWFDETMTWQTSEADGQQRAGCVDAVVPAKGHLAIKLGQDGGGAA